MRLSPLLALVLAIPGCKKEGSPDNAKPPGDTAKPPVDNAGDKTTKPADTAAKSEGAPKITPDMLFATEPVWTVEALPRGLWHRQLPRQVRQQPLVLAQDARFPHDPWTWTGPTAFGE